MKLNCFLTLFILLIFRLNTGTAFPAVNLQDDSNSIILADKLIDEVLSDPFGDNVPLYINKLKELAPATGKPRVAASLRDVLKRPGINGEREALYKQVFRLAIDDLENGRSGSAKNFSPLIKWNISGPWKSYGKSDIDYSFLPEKVVKFENIEKGRIIPADEDGVIYPFRFGHGSDETCYATSSLVSETGLILWIISDSKYRLTVNGRELGRKTADGTKSVRAFSLKGARGFTIQLKIQSGERGNYPFIRCMVTDVNSQPVQVINSGSIYNYSFSSEQIYASDEWSGTSSSEASVLTSRMKKLVQSGSYIEGYRLGLSIAGKYPSFFNIYKELFPLLDIMNRDEEFNALMQEFIRLFPDSDIRTSWLADFYMTRDRSKFFDIMKNNPIKNFSEKSAEAYILMLCGEKKFLEALSLCDSMKSDPRFSRLIPEVIKQTGNTGLLRKTLLEGAAERNEAGFYYMLGLTEKNAGLDPVMYWSKGYSLEDNPGLMLDLSDIYENGILGENDFYSGQYTDLHPEFRWDGKKRKISVHIFESGKVIIEGEDIIPSGNRIKKNKYNSDGCEFSSGEITSSIPFIKGVKVLYVLTASEGLPVAVNFISRHEVNNRLSVKFRSSGNEEFSVIKYSGEYNGGSRDLFTIIKGFELKNRSEKISGIEYEVICHGDFSCSVTYRGKQLHEEKFSDGITKTGIRENFSEDMNETVATDISRFSSVIKFTEWYGNLIKYYGKTFSDSSLKSLNTDNRHDIIKGIHYRVLSSISRRGGINFNPDNPDSVLASGEGTVEERTLLAKTLLGKKGIISFIAFRKGKNELIDRILLYVPEDRDKGYWLDFYGESVLFKIEAGYEALVITGEGYKTFPVNPETYIR